MARTIRRQPVTFSTDSSDYPKQYYFNQTQFNGISTAQNDVTVDQQTFADAKNMYIDDKGILSSRLPFKFDGNEAYIVDRWRFGRYNLGKVIHTHSIPNYLCHIFKGSILVGVGQA